MSGPLLIGIVGFGLGWVWVTSKANKKPAILDNQAASSGTDTKPDDSTVSQGVPRTVGDVVTAASCSSPATSIGESSAGTEGVIPVKLDCVEGDIVIVDNTKSTGGADPSTQPSVPVDPYQSPPFVNPADIEKILMESKHGISGSNGLTSQQVAESYKEAGLWAGGEVW